MINDFNEEKSFRDEQAKLDLARQVYVSKLPEDKREQYLKIEKAVEVLVSAKVPFFLLAAHEVSGGFYQFNKSSYVDPQFSEEGHLTSEYAEESRLTVHLLAMELARTVSAFMPKCYVGIFDPEKKPMDFWHNGNLLK